MKSGTEKNYFPFFLDISNKKFLVVGGGKVAERKIRSLLRFNAKVKVVSPKIGRNLKVMAEKGLICLESKEYETSDLKGIDFVISATNDGNLNRKISEDAEKKGIIANVVDDPSLCSFVMPSIVKKGPIVVAISTSGNLPLLSKKLRKDIQKMLNADYLRYFSRMSKIRRMLKREIQDRKAREKILRNISSLGVKEVARMNIREIKKLVGSMKK